MASVAVLGAGGHGRDVAAIAVACGLDVLFYDDNASAGLPSACGSLAQHQPYVVGVNDPATRRRLAVGSEPIGLVHPTATVASSARLGAGVVIGAGSHIGPDTVLGDHVHVGAGCTITRTHVGDFTTISPGVDIAGDVIVGVECLIGVGTTVLNLVRIGHRCVIGAGSVVISHVGSDMTVAGVPAKPLQRRESA